MMMQLLADAVHSNGDGVWLSVAAISALGGAAIGIVKAFKAGVQKGKDTQDNNVTIKKPVPTIQVREEQRFVGRDEFIERAERIDAEHSRIWHQFGKEREIWNHEVENLVKRLDVQSTATAKLQGTVDEVNKTTGQLLTMALNRKPPGTR